MKFRIYLFIYLFFAARGKVRAAMHRCPYLHWQESIAAHILPWKLIICLQDVPLLLCSGNENVIWAALLHALAPQSVYFQFLSLSWRAEMAGKEICWFRAILTDRELSLSGPSTRPLSVEGSSYHSTLQSLEGCVHITNVDGCTQKYTWPLTF